jgi:glutamine synthetase
MSNRIVGIRVAIAYADDIEYQIETSVASTYVALVAALAIGMAR